MKTPTWQYVALGVLAILTAIVVVYGFLQPGPSFLTNRG